MTTLMKTFNEIDRTFNEIDRDLNSITARSRAFPSSTVTNCYS